MNFGDKIERQCFGLERGGSLIWATTGKSAKQCLILRTQPLNHVIMKEYMPKHIGKPLAAGSPPPTARWRPSALPMLLPKRPKTQTAAQNAPEPYSNTNANEGFSSCLRSLRYTAYRQSGRPSHSRQASRACLARSYW